MRNGSSAPKPEKRSAVQAQAACVCGAVRLEIDVPGVWAWHDHGEPSRKAQGCAYATYVGSWKSRLRILDGEAHLTRFEDAERRTTRSFCARCGTPVLYERARSPKIVNIPRALFTSRTGREPRYHMNLAEKPDWTWSGEPLVPLKGYPGVLWERPKRKKPADAIDSLFSAED
ncbi:MAG: aldehyde-activating protein [Phenylobacterium sp.]|nr:aldehyde-activating protein [Phenylobacterium sp.]